MKFRYFNTHRVLSIFIYSFLDIDSQKIYNLFAPVVHVIYLHLVQFPKLAHLRESKGKKRTEPFKTKERKEMSPFSNVKYANYFLR